MCPAHPEQFIDSNLVTSTSLTERLRLWNKYAREPVDTETVRLDFFRKVRMGKLYQRCKRRIPLEKRVKVNYFETESNLCLELPLTGPPEHQGPVRAPAARRGPGL